MADTINPVPGKAHIKSVTELGMANVACNECGKVYAVAASLEKLREWSEGYKFVQDVFPRLSAGDRELLISGTCDSCFTRMFRLL